MYICNANHPVDTSAAILIESCSLVDSLGGLVGKIFPELFYIDNSLPVPFTLKVSFVGYKVLGSHCHFLSYLCSRVFLLA